MSALKSVQYMKDELSKAIGAEDWYRAQHCRDRLKSIILDATVRNEPDVIHAAGAVLSEAFTRLEIMNNLPMNYDATAMAWQLRADAGTAALAQRIRSTWNAPDAASEPEKTETPLTVEGLLQAMSFAETDDSTQFLWNLRVEIQRMLP